jgi:hypothetical protein
MIRTLSSAYAIYTDSDLYQAARSGVSRYFEELYALFRYRSDRPKSSAIIVRSQTLDEPSQLIIFIIYLSFLYFFIYLSFIIIYSV